MRGNPACDCMETSLWYTCCGREEWYAMCEQDYAEAEAERAQSAADKDRTHFSEEMLQPTSNLKPNWMDTIADAPLK